MTKEFRLEKCRFQVNWVLGLLLSGILNTVNTAGYLTSFHRFVTNPRHVNHNETKLNIIPGLGESEFFYSLIIAFYFTSACIATMVTGFLVACVPYWYLFITTICAHIVGYTVYGVATQGWHLLVSQTLSGFFIGAQLTLSYAYANDSSEAYIEMRKQREEKFENNSINHLRDSLYLLASVGLVLGYFIGPVCAVSISHLPIDQFRSIAWFNVAFGVVLLLLFIFLFRKESKCQKFSKCSRCAGSYRSLNLGLMQFFLLASMFLLSIIDAFKWGVPETLLNPILSDSFGLSLTITSYFYVGLGVPQMFGLALLYILQKLKISNTILLLIGIIITIIAYFILADWQTIPYDPCTEYSPFHHPEIVKHGLSHNQTFDQIESPSSGSFDIRFYSNIALEIKGKPLKIVSLPVFTKLSCSVDPQYRCNVSTQRTHSCMKYTVTAKEDLYLKTEIPSCYICYSDRLNSECFSLHIVGGTRPSKESKAVVGIQELQVLSDSSYSIASNSCTNANVPSHHCHWIPFSTVTHTKCHDCPPICRATEQTLNFVQFLIGLSLLVASLHMVYVPMMGVATDHAPTVNNSKGAVIGCINTTTLLAQALCPLILDASYEGFQKRNFFMFILLGILHIPFIFEIIVLYKYFSHPSGEEKN